MKRHLFLLVATMATPCLPLVLIMDKTQCWNCTTTTPQTPCEDPVTGADETEAAVNWSLARLVKQGNIDNSSAAVLDVRDTCGMSGTATQQMIEAIASKESLKPVVLASKLNPLLSSQLKGLNLPSVLIAPTLGASWIQATADLLQMLGWSQVAVLTEEKVADQLGQELARARICLLHWDRLLDEKAGQDEQTSLLRSLRDAGVENLLISGWGSHISRLVRSMFSLSLPMAVVALPWDGPVAGMPASQSSIPLLQLIPIHSDMPEFAKDWSKEALNGVQGSSPLTWPLVKAVVGLVLPSTAGKGIEVREKLGLSYQPPRFRVDQLDSATARWVTVATWAEEQRLEWSGSKLAPRMEKGCEWCKCQNGMWRGEAAWRREAWVTAIATAAGVGTLASVAILVFLLAQCGQVLEGSQATTLALLAATATLFAAVAPYCLQPGELVCHLRSVAPPAAYSLLLAVTLARVLLLATADSDGLPGHASGGLQLVIMFLLLVVEAALLVQESFLRTEPYLAEERRGRAGVAVCREAGWPWLARLLWPAVLLALQTLMTPWVWTSRRNYKEGLLISLASVAMTCLAAAWVAIYVLCAELWGNHWEDIAVCGGMVSTAGAILLFVFIPKVYLMTVWGAGREVSLQLPATATSTLHTDTINFIRGQDYLYKQQLSAADRELYENMPGNRRGLTEAGRAASNNQTLVSNGQLPLGVVGLPGLQGAPTNSTYKLDAATEAEPGMEWEAFEGTHGLVDGGPRVSRAFVNSLAGYGYTAANEERQQEDFGRTELGQERLSPEGLARLEADFGRLGEGLGRLGLGDEGLGTAQSAHSGRPLLPPTPSTKL